MSHGDGTAALIAWIRQHPGALGSEAAAALAKDFGGEFVFGTIPRLLARGKLRRSDQRPFRYWIEDNPASAMPSSSASQPLAPAPRFSAPDRLFDPLLMAHSSSAAHNATGALILPGMSVKMFTFGAQKTK